MTEDLEKLEDAAKSLEEVAQKSAASKEDTLEALSKAATRRFQLLKEIEIVEAQLTAKQGELREIDEKIIPELMDNVGIPEFKLPSGHKIIVSDHISVSIPKTEEDAAFEWMEVHGHGDIIKNELSINFGKEENEKARQLKERLIAEGFDPSMKRAVHPSSLRAWAKDIMKKGTILPTGIFSTWVTRKAVIK